ncbi:MAG TPA: hypothetical protein VIK89_12245 [Cytophagaceae bacterium]
MAVILLLSSFSLAGRGSMKSKEKKAEKFYANGYYSLALPLYQDLLKLNPEELKYKMKVGVCLLQTRKRRESIPYLESASYGGLTEAYYYLGQAYHYANRLDEALNAYLMFKKLASVEAYLESDIDKMINTTLTAKEMMKNPVNVEIQNMGSKINSESSDYVPVISADESVLIFTSRREGTTGGLKDFDNEYFEDVYIAFKEGDDWTNAINIGPEINTPSHDASIGLSPDGQKLFIYRTNKDVYGGDIYESVLDGTMWSTPTKLPPEINSGNWEPSASLSSDGNYLYFASNRPGGYGGRDIYVSKRLPDGRWGIAQNLGAIINSKYDEDAPFIHPDGKTLYFSSKGHKNMGGFDIFKSELKDGLWTIPENIGYPINTVDDDIYFVLSAQGKRGYYSSNREGGLGGQDIYQINMEVEEVPLTLIKGYVVGTSKTPVKSVIHVIDNDTKELQGIYTSNASSGKYILILPPGKSYKIIVEAEGFHSLSQNFDVPEVNQYKEIIHDFELKPLSK